MLKVVFLRHGESEWNRENKFTGWVDIGLSDQGIREADEAGKLLSEKGYTFDKAFTSVLRRATETTEIVLKNLGLSIPVISSWRLNERHYGALQGINKIQAVAKYSYDTVYSWRRSYASKPPLSSVSDVIKEGENRYEINGESLKDTYFRCIPYWRNTILPEIEKGRMVLISAHGNSIRAIIKEIESIPDAEISSLEIPTGVPLVYEFSEGKFGKRFFLGDQKIIEQRIQRVKDQLKNKNL